MFLFAKLGLSGAAFYVGQGFHGGNSGSRKGIAGCTVINCMTCSLAGVSKWVLLMPYQAIASDDQQQVRGRATAASYIQLAGKILEATNKSLRCGLRAANQCVRYVLEGANHFAAAARLP